MEMVLTCDCGEKVTVTAASAGAAIPCSCGRTILVPSLDELGQRSAELNISAVRPGEDDQSQYDPVLVGPASRGSLRIFRVAGTDVFVHWSWLIAAYFRLNDQSMNYTSWAWNVAELLMVFGIVLLHEFGHVLACRQVGGTSNRIVLWPLGGLAFAHAPPRPGAELWTIAAGPLVNLLLVPISIGLPLIAGFGGWEDPPPDPYLFLLAFGMFNALMLVFNLLPIYPLDGGQIVRALLWFVMGRVRSLFVAASIGLVAGIVLIGLALYAQDWWFVLMAAFISFASWGGIAHARSLRWQGSAARHSGLACPSCAAAPPVGPWWRCRQCLQYFDLFRPGSCPKGGPHAIHNSCLDCGAEHEPSQWIRTAL